MDDVLLISKVDGIATLTLNRPERRNALNPALLDRLAAGVAATVDDPSVRVIILTGAGGAFCSGGDLKGSSDAAADRPRSRTIEERTTALRRHTEAARLLHRTPKPTIAMIPGAAVGAGLSLAAACDLRIASESAVFRSGFAPNEFSGDFGGSYFWTRILGSARARELYLLSEKFDSRQALQYGLVHRVVPDADLIATTWTIARGLAARLPSTWLYMKRNLDAAQTASLEEVLELEALNMVLSAHAAFAAYKARTEAENTAEQKQ